MKAERRAGERAAPSRRQSELERAKNCGRGRSSGFSSSSSTNSGHHNDFASTRDHNAARLVRAPLSDDVRARQRPDDIPRQELLRRPRGRRGADGDGPSLRPRVDGCGGSPEKARVRASRASPRETPRVHVPLAARRAPPRARHRHPSPRGSRPVVGRPPPPLGRRARHLRPDHAPKPHHPPRAARPASAPPRRRVGVDRRRR